jgi:hypothetical protein
MRSGYISMLRGGCKPRCNRKVGNLSREIEALLKEE